MASIRKRNNRYQARITKKGLPQLTRTFGTKAEAVAWSNAIEGKAIAYTQDHSNEIVLVPIEN